jgi:hypothetical protein
MQVAQSYSKKRLGFLTYIKVLAHIAVLNIATCTIRAIRSLIKAGSACDTTLVAFRVRLARRAIQRRVTFNAS